jgi:hypothetical protein
MTPKNPCLGCGKECTGQQYSVCCTLCSLWCHKEWAGITDAFFRNLELQKKEIGQSFWACRSCVSFASTFATKVNAKLKEVNDRVDSLQVKVKENTGGLGKYRTNLRRWKERWRRQKKGRKTAEDMEKNMEEGIYEEMRAREAIKRNIVINTLKEADLKITDGIERLEADKAECEKIFIAAGSEARKKDIRFCRQIGEKGEEPRPVLLGMKSETIKCDILDQARELRNTEYKGIGIRPDQTKKQIQDWQPWQTKRTGRT